MKRILKKIIADIIIILSLMMITFFVIDLFNESMAFLNNTMTKVIAFILSVFSLIFSVIYIFTARND